MEPSDQQPGVLDALREIQRTQSLLVNAVESLSAKPAIDGQDAIAAAAIAAPVPSAFDPESSNGAGATDSTATDSSIEAAVTQQVAPSSPSGQRPGYTSRIILTTYPKQIGINPLPMDWGNSDPLKRGPIVVSRAPSTIRRRNAIGVSIRYHSGGSYSIYYALAVASKELDSDHRPDYTNTEPTVDVGPFPQWGSREKIVAMDPWGHLSPWLFKDLMKQDSSTAPKLQLNVNGWLTNVAVDIRPTIAITKAHMKLPELAESVKAGRLVPDGKVCLNELGELAVTKFAVEPVWYLPGVAERFGIDEGTLRRSLFEHTGGSYPELITRADIKVFLPPIGGLTVYCFGDPAKMSDESVRLALRVHDECNGSDVFGSDICTCRPYLIFGIEEAVKEAQNGGSGVVIYFRKEGRALGEVTKTRRIVGRGADAEVVVYNARKRGEDRASDYFKRTENIAGVKDMRFQALMPDILHWLGIKKIDRMLSMSNMKHDAIVGQGIPIHERIELPTELIPADSRVEIDAKITAGYFTTGKRMTAEELQAVQGRMWEDVDH
ncbi:Uracil-regulated protein 1 [Neonectria punicea]|uniref:Uracil-regulated protein 1 n=1 Tax=Neonectria punicea TaxID=979145 RepID=A0ABR1GI96_9HYPO